MKKILLVLVAMLGISFMANAQSCKISGATDGSTIMVSQDRLEGDKVIVNLENDSESTCANVTVTVEVSYGNTDNNNKTFTGRVKSCPNATATVTIPIQTTNKNLKLRTYKVTVSGNKCN